MTLVDRSVRRQLTAAMALALALALVLPSVAFAQATANEVEAVAIDDSCNDVPEDGFKDVPEVHTFDDEIECLKAYGFTEGAKDGSVYEPGKPTRRWQMVQFIARVAEEVEAQVDEFTLPEASDQGFDDIGGLEQRFQDNINVMAEIGVVQGKDANTFDPFTNVKRDQMASFINRLQGAIQDSLGDNPDGFTTDEDFFPDDEGNVHEGNINGLASVGIVQGKVDGDYDPRENVTRGQMSAFIMRHYEVNVDAGVLQSKYPQGSGTEGVVGEIVEENDAENFYRFLPEGEASATRIDYFDNENFFVDGVEATVALFEDQSTPGDAIEYINGGDGPSTHKLTNNTVADGFIGGYDAGADATDGGEIVVINTVTGDLLTPDLGAPGVLDYSDDPLTVDGAAATEAQFEAALNEGDTIEVEDLGGDDETFNLINGTLSGTVVDDAAASVDVELATGAVVTDVDATGGTSYTVDGEAVLEGAFTTALSVGDAVTFTAVNDAGTRETTWTLVNMAPGTVSGVGADDHDDVADTFTLVRNDGAPVVVDYTVADVTALGQDAEFYVDGVASTEAEFETAYTAGDGISWQAASDAGAGQDQILSLTNQNLRGTPANVDTTAVGGATFDVLGPDDETELAAITYVTADDDVFINGAQITVDEEETLEGTLVAIESGIVDGAVEIVAASGGDARQIRVTTNP